MSPIWTSAPAPSRTNESVMPELVIDLPEPMIAAVEGVDRFARHIAKRPPLTRVHAGVVDPGAEHVVVVSDDDAIERIDDLTLVALDVDGDARRVELFDRRSGRRRVAVLESVPGDRQERAAE